MIFNIRRQFLAYTLGIVLAVAAAIAMATIRDSRDRELTQFGEKAETVTRMLAGSLVNDLYFLDLQSASQKLNIVNINSHILAAHLLGPKGEVIITQRVGEDMRGSALPADLLASLLQTRAVVTRVVDDQVIYTAMPIAMIDGDVLGFIAVSYSLDEVHEQLEEIANSMTMTTGVAVVMAGILALLASWYFARPILAIKDAALAVSHGALHTRSAVKRRDEIGHLSAAINAMADNLVQRLSELELARLALSAAKDETEEANRQVNLLNQDLEWRVAARTAELREAQHSLMQRERLSALGQLTATVAHELRNPISVIQNTLFTMKAALAGRGMTLDKPIARMERSISRCNRIISDLLDYSRQRDLQYSERDLDEWLAAAVAEHPRSADLAIECDLGAGGIVARFDIERLRRVAINLIDNAAQALAEKPPVGTAPRIVVGTRATDDGVELFVRDNGPGIAPDVLPKIFEPLFSTKAFGTGLGLPTVKQIVEQHGGRIDVTSEAGIGTDVRIRLPIIAQRTVAA